VAGTTIRGAWSKVARICVPLHIEACADQGTGDNYLPRPMPFSPLLVCAFASGVSPPTSERASKNTAPASRLAGAQATVARNRQAVVCIVWYLGHASRWWAPASWHSRSPSRRTGVPTKRRRPPETVVRPQMRGSRKRVIAVIVRKKHCCTSLAS
jgi:hypothetical protein